MITSIHRVKARKYENVRNAFHETSMISPQKILFPLIFKFDLTKCEEKFGLFYYN